MTNLKKEYKEQADIFLKKKFYLRKRSIVETVFELSSKGSRLKLEHY